MQRAFPGAHRVESRMDPQLTSQIVPAEEIKVIEECLVRLAEDTGGNYVLLLDKSGQVITAQGDAARQDITALGALIAGTFASSREVAKLLREKDFRQLFTQGVRENIFISLIEDQWILCIIFNKGTHIGLVKVLTKKATDDLSVVLERVREQQKARDDVLGSSFRTSMEDTIDLLFRD
ncbi:Roadblock/LC7 family protein [Roseiflexus sp. RS-1]|jgi:predicted regulator of Ras-like GTPase activity (Roadblock/LC7/MglB family)|nr:Roadblock/LC7 family protein [Roseiflexus sp. RS-1]